MKKICSFFTFVLLSTQIVNAGDKVTDATLKNQGTETQASTLLWLTSEKVDPSVITMTLAEFDAEFFKVLSAFNAKYKTFSAITDDVLKEKILPQLYADELEKRVYTLSNFNLETRKFAYTSRMMLVADLKLGGIYFPGWREPLLHVWCWNFGHIDDVPVIKAPEIPQTETVIKPGKKTYTYTSDTEFVRHDVYKEVQNNFFLKTDNNTFASTRNNNQSFDVDMNVAPRNNTGASNVNYNTNNCNCGSQQPQKQAVYEEPSCGCTEQYTCKKHKDRKPFFNTVGGRILSHAVAFGAGYGLSRILDKDGGNGTIQSPPIITQGPFTPLESNGYSQAVFQ